MTQTPPRLPHVMRGVGIFFLVGLVFVAIPLFLSSSSVKAQSVLVGRLYMLSKTPGGSVGNNQSYQPDVSSDGRLVAFASDADNLVSGDDNGRADILVLDRTLNQLEMVSLQSNGNQANDSSFEPAISGDGRWVVFCSFATNLVNGDTNNRSDTFLYDRQQNEIRRLSEANNNDNGNANSCGRTDLSNNGDVVVFVSDANNLVLSDTNNVRDVFIYTRSDDTVRRINAAGGAQPNGVSDSPSISADGRYIAFQSDATNFVSGDDNGKTDIYIYDRTDNDIEIASQRQDGADGTGTATFPTISGDGRFVVFQGTDGNLIANDNNGKTDVFLHVRDGNLIERVSVEDDGAQSNGNSTQGVISNDGRYVTFTSDATNLVDTRGATISNIFVRDRVASTTTGVSYTLNNAPGNSNSDTPSITADGRYIVFASGSTNLLPEDTNNRADVYLWDRDASPPVEPNFTITPPNARPGSVFTAQVVGFRPTASVAIYVNNVNVGSVSTDAAGALTFGLNSSNASNGRYTVRVSDGSTERVAGFVLSPIAPLVGGNPPVIFPIPNGIAYRGTYLPSITLND